MVLMYKVSNASTRSAHNDLFTREYHRRFTRQQGKACVRRHGGGPCGGGETAALHEERAMAPASNGSRMMIGNVMAGRRQC